MQEGEEKEQGAGARVCRQVANPSRKEAYKKVKERNRKKEYRKVKERNRNGRRNTGR